MKGGWVQPHARALFSTETVFEVLHARCLHARALSPSSSKNHSSVHWSTSYLSPGHSPYLHLTQSNCLRLNCLTIKFINFPGLAVKQNKTNKKHCFSAFICVFSKSGQKKEKEKKKKGATQLLSGDLKLGTCFGYRMVSLSWRAIHKRIDSFKRVFSICKQKGSDQVLIFIMFYIWYAFKNEPC